MANAPGEFLEFEWPTTEVNPSTYSCTIELEQTTAITRNTGSGAVALTAGYAADYFIDLYVKFAGAYTREADPGKTFNVVSVVKNY